MYIPFTDDPALALISGPPPGMYRGLGCGPGCGCGSCQSRGMGLFDSMSPTSWGWSEWILVAIGLYAIGSLFFQTRRGVRTVRRTVKGRKRRKTAARVKKLQAEIDRLQA